jgi:uncharacterized GH25 family protein
MPDSRRPIATQLGRCSLCTAIVFAIGLGPLLRADDAKTGPPPPNPKPASGSAPTTPTLELRIVDPDGKPVPEAKVNVNTQPPIDTVKLRAGTLLNKPRFGVNLRSDADGRVIVELPVHLTYLTFQIRKAGFGYYSKWWNFQNKPETLAPTTAKLERAWTIGGIVVDGAGKPVPNARVLLQVRIAGMGGTVFADRLWTNSKGIWKFESVPESMSSVTAEISEPKYMAASPTLGRAEFEIKPGNEPTAKTTLQVGVVVTGKITDEAGKPIAKALVRTRVGNDTRSAFTGKDGVYRLEGCGTTQQGGGAVVIAGGNGVFRREGPKPGQVTIVASAKGRAAQVQHAEIGPGRGPVNFELKPGGTIRVRVLDEQGRPAPKATVFIQAWGGDFDYFQFDTAPREADVDGVWEWHEAPTGELLAFISRPNGMTLDKRLTVRKEEYVFRVPPALVISGKVVDAETKQPIKTFRAVRGTRWIEQQQVSWDTNNKLMGADGTYQMRETWEQSAYLVRIEAAGYLHGVSRDIKCDEGKVVVDFELLKGTDVAATVLTPEGVPAGRAKVAVVGGNVGPVINHGEIDIKGGRRDIPETDATGRFRIATKNDGFWLVVTHPSGYAELTGLPNSNPRVIKLAPWARIEGTFQLAHKPQAEIEISLDNAQFFGPNAAIDRASQTTDLHGRFAFDRVIPGKRRISAKRTSGEGASETTCSRSMAVDCPAGKTARVDFESGGRPVIGQLQAPSDSKPGLQLSAAQIYVDPEGGGARADSQMQFRATPDRKGNFSIDEVPPGNYLLSAFIPGRRDAYVQSHRFTVPRVNEKLSQRPVDVGVLTLEPARRFQGAQKK